MRKERKKRMEDTRLKIIRAAMQGVRQYGLEGVRIQNISDLAGLTPGALYRYFQGKNELMVACFTWVDKQVAALFDRLQLDGALLRSDPVAALRSLWLPYFRFWTSRPNETVFYHRFRDSAYFPTFDKMRDVSYFDKFVAAVRLFQDTYPKLGEIDQNLLWLHVLNVTVLYAKYVVEGVLPNSAETEDTVFQLMVSGLSGYLFPQGP